MQQRILVTGGRDYANREILFRILDAAHASNPIDALIHGAARGADTLAQEWADDRGVCCLPFPADWKIDGKAAGPIRNARMLLDGKPDLVIAFPGGKGTADMKKRARSAGVPIVTIIK